MNNKFIKALLVTLFALTTTDRPLFATDMQIAILDKPVRVTATNNDGPEADETHYSLEIKIEYAADRYKFNTLIFLQNSNVHDAINYQKNHTHWNGRYLFVGWERGGGNAARGYLDTVFILKKGKLQYIGEAGSDSFENGNFKDWYDKFEVNALTSHAESPLVRIVLEEKNSRLVVDLEKTWNENQKRFNDNKWIIKDIQIKEKNKSESRAAQLSGPLLFNAVLGKYCKHDKETESFVAMAEQELDKERLQMFKGVIAHIKPGELPKTAVDLQKN